MSFQENHYSADDNSQNEQPKLVNIEESQAKLDELLDEIDATQEKIDNLHEQLSETELKITHTQSEISKIKKVKQKRLVEFNYQEQTDAPNFDLNLLNTEHKDLVRDMLNNIYNKELQLEQLEGENKELGAEVDSINYENDSFSKEIRNLKIQLQRKRQDRQLHQNEINLTQSKIKEYGQTIRMNNQTLKITSVALNGVVLRQEDLNSENGGMTELSKSIYSTENEIDQEEDDIRTIDNQTIQYQEDHDTAIQQIKSEQKAHKRVVNWEKEIDFLKAEIDATRTELKEKTKENDEQTNKSNKLTDRLRLLTPIVKKWRNSDLSDVEINENENIDVLLNKVHKLTEKTSKLAENENQGPSGQTVENAEKEGKIKQLRDELDRQIFLFQVEEKNLKDKIERYRTKAFEEEHDIVTQMNALKVKIAQIKTKV